MAKGEDNRMVPDMELVIETPIGKMTGVFLSTEVSCYQTVYTAWLKEKQGVIVQADSINEAIDELLISLNLMLEVEKCSEEDDELDALEAELLKLDYRN